MTIHAHTDQGASCPAYINISERVANPGDVVVTVRSAGENGTSSIILSHEHLHALVKDAEKYLGVAAHAGMVKESGWKAGDASEAAIEREIVAKGLAAPRLSPADLDANIVHIEFVKHVSLTGQVLRWAVLTTKNGFAVVGKPSVAVSPANDNAEIGEKVAIDNSRAELWPLMGYALKQALWEKDVSV